MNEINSSAERVAKKPISEDCKGCSKVLEDSTCSAYQNPESWWRRGRCPLADHIKVKEVSSNAKVRAGQQKQKKKDRRKGRI